MEAASLNTPEPLKDALLALTAVNQDVVVLNYGNILIRKDYKNMNTVRLLSGGISGTDLVHAHFVGKGMLTGAVMEESSTPSSRLILHTIKELNVGQKCGVFVISEMGPDMFNFGLAVERANEDFKTRVKLLTLNDKRNFRKERYSAGWILMVKVLGAMAESGAIFNDIWQCYKDIVDHIVTVPLQYIKENLSIEEVRTFCFTSELETHVRNIIDCKSQSKLQLHPSVPIAVLINISNELTKILQLRLIKQVLSRLKELGVCTVRLYYGNFHALHTEEATLTIMKITDFNLLDYLDAHCNVPGWRCLSQFQAEVTLNNEIPGMLMKEGRQHIVSLGPKLNDRQTKILLQAVQFACDALTACEKQLNVIDSSTSQGNVGNRLKNMAKHVTRRLDQNLYVDCPYAFLKKFGIISESSMGGTMGSIYGMWFEKGAGFFAEVPEHEKVTGLMWSKALTTANTAVKGLCTPEMHLTTMLYPLEVCGATVVKELNCGRDILESFAMGVSSAEEAAQRTRNSNNRHPDAGAHAVGIWMRAVFEGVKLMSLSE